MVNKDIKIKIPQPSDITEREREDAMGAYLMMFAAAGIGLPIPFVSLIASIIYYFINKKTSDFVAFHAYQSLITQTPVSILNAVAIVWGIGLLLRDFTNAGDFLTFVLFTAIMNVLYFIFSIIGAVRARKGRFYYFLFFGRMAFSKFYGPRALNKKKKEAAPNLPPSGF